MHPSLRIKSFITFRAITFVAAVLLLIASSFLSSLNSPLLAKHSQPFAGSSWNIIPSPNAGTQDYLRGVAAVSASDVWTVGNYYNGNNVWQTLTEHWDGNQWSVVSSPSPGSQYNYLFGVAAVSSTNVWAVGYFPSNPYSQTLIEHWDGNLWSVVPSPNPNGYGSVLLGVAAVSASNVWAVGYFLSNGYGVGQTLIEHWDGNLWSVVPSPSPSSNAVNSLSGVAAVSSTNVWAVGYIWNNYGGSQTIIEHWNGSLWSVVPSPNPGSYTNFLNGVTVVSASNVWAVGKYYNGGGGSQPLSEHWNGTKWSVVPSPDPGPNSDLNGVAAVSATDVWAVGNYYNGYGDQTLIEHWDGNLWSVVSSPNPPSSVNTYLYGVTALSSSDVWAVGNYANYQQYPYTLIEHYSPSSTPTPSPSPSPTPTPPPSQLIQLSSDKYRNSTSQHKTEVEPDTFSYGSTIVSAFQVSRFSDKNGGSDNIGWATSSDNGTTWKSDFLSGITKIAGGKYDRVSDPSVVYDAAHNTWMIASIGIVIKNGNIAGTAILVSRSSDGLTWLKPVLVASSEYFDKPWIVCDNTASSQFYSHCYIEWDDYLAGGLIVMATSTDGGTKWVQALTANKATGTGGQPLVQPNGTVIVPIDNFTMTAIQAFTSTDGGTSWSSTVTVAQIYKYTMNGNLLSDPFPSAEIDGAGTVYLVWQDCRFESNCSANDIVMSTSTDGISWSYVTRIPIDPVNSGVDHFIPGLAVDISTSGSTAHLALTFYYLPMANCSTNCQLDVGFVSSLDSGNSWSVETQLAGPMKPSWLAKTDYGYMVGDYISTSFSGSKAYPVIAVATAPVGKLLNEGMYTVKGGLS